MPMGIFFEAGGVSAAWEAPGSIDWTSRAAGAAAEIWRKRRRDWEAAGIGILAMGGEGVIFEDWKQATRGRCGSRIEKSLRGMRGKRRGSVEQTASESCGERLRCLSKYMRISKSISAVTWLF